jgi:hypothetical protein
MLLRVAIVRPKKEMGVEKKSEMSISFADAVREFEEAWSNPSSSTIRAEGYYSWAEAEWIAREWSTYPAPISPYSMLSTRRGAQRKIHSIYGASLS